ncbi:MAG: CHAD domain-containing protein [Pseudomonadota bacterium]
MPTPSTRRIEVRGDLTLEKIHTVLAAFADPVGPIRKSILRPCDTFDGALHRAGLAAYWTESGRDLTWLCHDLVTGELRAKVELSADMHEAERSTRPIVFAELLAEKPVGEDISSVLGYRNPLDLAQLPVHRRQYVRRDEEGKMILRVEHLHPMPRQDQGEGAATQLGREDLSPWLEIHPVRGYLKKADEFCNWCKRALGGVDTDAGFVKSLIEAGHIKPTTYSSKLSLDFGPKTSARTAAFQTFRHLFGVMETNFPGVLADADSEFLHDFRVAVRRARAALHLFRRELSRDVREALSHDLKKLGQMTGPVRDFDVYLLDEKQLRGALPTVQQHDLDPFFDHLVKERAKARASLVSALETAETRDALSHWLHFFSSDPETTREVDPGFSGLAAKALRIQLTRMLTDGRKITKRTPAEALHDLRKEGKKLRYILEMSRSVLAEELCSGLLKSLKRLQTILGNFQDFEVQADFLMEAADTMNRPALKSQSAREARTKAVMALGVLSTRLMEKKTEARAQFAAEFADFDNEERSASLKTLRKMEAKASKKKTVAKKPKTKPKAKTKTKAKKDRA